MVPRSRDAYPGVSSVGDSQCQRAPADAGAREEGASAPVPRVPTPRGGVGVLSMWFLPPAGRHRAGYRRILGRGSWCLVEGQLSRGDEPHAVALPVAMLAGRSPRASAHCDVPHPRPARVVASRRLACAGLRPRKHREGIPTARQLQPSESDPSAGTTTPTDEAAVPAAMPPAGGRNLMDNTPTPPTAVGSRRTGAEAPTSRAPASAGARWHRESPTLDTPGTRRLRAAPRHPSDKCAGTRRDPSGGRKTRSRHADIAYGGRLTSESASTRSARGIALRRHDALRRGERPGASQSRCAPSCAGGCRRARGRRFSAGPS